MSRNGRQKPQGKRTLDQFLGIGGKTYLQEIESEKAP
jgi:hypothetical protein